ncbi:TIGR02221 family CRISPR-associated protein [Falsiroseomonas sp.]|uniref:TIGR02221 family CRISPR-associated protein n=1 Tax=Falsiroseomonas sp. TaxID=2870721 RepID=UPI003F708A26
MATILFTCLGGVGAGAGRPSYPTATYLFSDAPRRESYFALALLDHLRVSHPGRRPDRLVILGTSGSFWDNLIAHAAEEDPELAPLWEETYTRARAQDLDQAAVDRLAAPLARRIGIAVDPVVIPPGRILAEQVAVIRAIHDRVAPGDGVWLDVTHGLRHLAMLGLLAAGLIRRLRGAVLHGIWYAAFDLGTPIPGSSPPERAAPVLRLEGLLEALDWLEADAAFAASGDLAVLAAPLMAAEGPAAPAAQLRRAGRRERAMLPLVAAKDARAAARALPEDGIAALFAPRLRGHLAWAETEDEGRMLAALARLYLARGDLLRATILGFEAVVAALPVPPQDDAAWLEAKGMPDKAAMMAFSRTASRSDPARADAFEMLRVLRNGLAHAAEPRQEAAKALLRDPDRLAEALPRLFDRLLLPG